MKIRELPVTDLYRIMDDHITGKLYLFTWAFKNSHTQKLVSKVHGFAVSSESYIGEVLKNDN